MTNKQEGDSFEIGIKDMDKFLERYELKRLHTDFFQKIALLIIASLGFIAAIAWDSALKLIFIELFGGLESVGDKIQYAALITIIAVLLSILLSKIFLKKESKK